MPVVIDGTTGVTSPAIDLTTPLVAADGGTGLSSVGTAGNVLTSNGTAWTSSAPTPVSPMTLLGTITPTAVNSINLGSLTLTSYKALFIVFNNIIVSAGAGNRAIYISSTNRQSGGGLGFDVSTFPTISGTGWLDLNTGVIGGGFGTNTVQTNNATGVLGGLTNVSTSTTTISFRCEGTSTFTASGSIRIYGLI